MPPSPSAASETALELIYRRHQGLVRWVLRARGVPEASLDDHVHDVFLAILRRLPERDPSVSMRAWVAGVARNVSFSHHRTAARQQQRALRLVPPDDPPRPDEELERREAWQALHAFLDDLGPEQREVFVMVEVSGMRISELAASMGMPANTLHSRLKVARTRFSQRFEGAGEPPAALLQRAREQGRADPKERRRTWAMIAASMESLPGLPSAGAAVGGASKVAWLVGGSRVLTAVTLAVGVLGAAAVVGTRSPAVREAETKAAPRSVAAKQTGLATAAEAAPRASEEPVAEAGLGAMRAPASSPEPTLARRPRDSTRARPSAHASRTDAAAREPGVASGSPQPSVASPAGAAREQSVADGSPEPTDTELVRAMSALQRARDHLALDHAREALAALDAHDASFGMLERERRRLELDAACRLDDASRSRRAVAALVRLGAAVDPEAPCSQRGD